MCFNNAGYYILHTKLRIHLAKTAYILQSLCIIIGLNPSYNHELLNLHVMFTWIKLFWKNIS